MSDKKFPEKDDAPNGDSYAVRVFQESSVGMVSSLYNTHSLRRKAFKILALIICLGGFLYQSGQFLAVVFQYPTTVNIDIQRPKLLQIPGYTFCDNNGINRRIFCEKFPDRCEEASEDFCKKYEYYCGEAGTLIPKRQYYSLNIDMSLEDMVELNVNGEEFVEIHKNPPDENITGPHMRKRDPQDPSYVCYSLYDRVNSSLSSPTTHKEILFKEAVNKFVFNVRSDEMFIPGNRAGVLFSIHSPYQAVNPFENGIFMKPGRTYMVFVSMEEEILLEKPYKTDCVNYSEIWEARGHAGPRTQEMCLQECLNEISMRCFNCVVAGLLYPTTERICRLDEVNATRCPDDVEDQFDNCEVRCKDDCHRVKFSYTVQERFSSNLVENMESEDDIFTKIGVEIYLEGDEIFVLQHSPKYMIVEVFSSIGGFIGCWLGISLLGILDIIEGLLRIARHSFKTRLPPKEEKIAL